MDIVFKCPHCQTELEVDSTASGESINCPACNRALTIPATAATPPPPSGAGTPAAAPVRPVHERELPERHSAGDPAGEPGAAR